MPLSVIVTTADVVLGQRPHLNLAAGLGVLGRIRQQVRDALREPHLVGVHPERLRAHAQGEPMFLFLDQRLRGLDRGVDARLQR